MPRAGCSPRAAYGGSRRCGFSAILQLRGSKPAPPGMQPWPAGGELLEGELLSTAPLKQPNLALTTFHAVKGKQYIRAQAETSLGKLLKKRALGSCCLCSLSSVEISRTRSQYFHELREQVCSLAINAINYVDKTPQQPSRVICGKENPLPQRDFELPAPGAMLPQMAPAQAT